MFKKTERLTRTEFTTQFNIGVRYHTPALTLIYTIQDPLQVAVVVGKKVFKRAVNRNCLRRRIYAAMRRYFIKYKITSGTYIIITKPSAAAFTRQETGDAVNNILAQISNLR